MIPGSTRTFYRTRRALLVLAWLLPVLVLGGGWWLVTEVLLAPRVPTKTSGAEDVFEFIVDEKGLPRLAEPQVGEFFAAQLERLRNDAALREQFLSIYRTASSSQQEAFRAHLFDAFKPGVLRDARSFCELPESQRREFLDARVLDYARLAAFWGNVRISKEALGGGALSPTEMLGLVMNKTTPEEREIATTYFTAYGARVNEIIANPDLKRVFEDRARGQVQP